MKFKNRLALRGGAFYDHTGREPKVDKWFRSELMTAVLLRDQCMRISLLSESLRTVSDG